MYIQIHDGKIPTAHIGRQLFKRLEFKQRRAAFIQIVQIKGTDRFAIIKRFPSDTFKTQCCMVKRTGDRKRPGIFEFTIPSLEYMRTVMGKLGSNILKVKEQETNGIKYFEICGR